MAIRTFYGWSEGPARAAEVAAKYGGAVISKVCGYGEHAREVVGVEFAAGSVISTSSRDVRIMSDVYGDDHYAVFWDAAAGRPIEFVYATSSDVSNHYGSAEVDATEEVTAFACAYGEGKARGAIWKAAERRAAEREVEEADRAEAAAKAADAAVKKAAIAADESTVRVGDVVEVTRGNKSTSKGTTGRVFWTGWSKRGGASWRIGFHDGPGNTHWIAASAVKVVEKGPAKRVVEVAAAGFTAKVSNGSYVVITAGKDEGVVGWVFWVGTDRYTGAPRFGVRSWSTRSPRTR